MTQTITRMYATPQIAATVVGELKANGFTEQEVALVAYSGGHDRASNLPAANVDSLTAEIMAARIPKAHARVFAEGVSRGGSLVTVHAMFGRGALATHILDSFDPIESGVADPAYPMGAWDDAAPVSSALQMGVLWDQPAPFSAFWNIPVLADKATSLSGSLHIPMLANHAASLSRTVGLPTLIPHTGSWSEKVGIPVLWRRRPARA